MGFEAAMQEDGYTPDGLATEEWERTYSLFVHLSLLLWSVLMPVVPALVMWLIKRDQSQFVDDHGREVVNFQISLLIYGFMFGILGVITCGIAWVLIPGLYILGIIGMILGTIAAHKGRYYRYPMCLRLIS
jgi:uncharacterized Tic20 family protein